MVKVEVMHAKPEAAMTNAADSATLAPESMQKTTTIPESAPEGTTEYTMPKVEDEGRFTGFVQSMKVQTYAIVLDDGSKYEVTYNGIQVTTAPKEVWTMLLVALGQTMHGKKYEQAGCDLLMSTAAQDLSTWEVWSAEVPYDIVTENNSVWWKSYPTLDRSPYAVALKKVETMPSCGQITEWWRKLYENWSMIEGPMSGWQSGTEAALTSVSIIFQERRPKNRHGTPIGLTKLTQNVSWDADKWFMQETMDETNPVNYWQKDIKWEPKGYQTWDPTMKSGNEDSLSMPAA